MAKEMPQMRALKPRQLLYQTVQDEIKAYIIEHGLKPGDALPPEGVLSQQLNISRNSVREAVKSLETLGILEARPGAGLFVRDFTFDSILNNLPYGVLFSLKHLNDILEIRALVECGMVEKVIRLVTDGQLAQLEAVLGRMREAAERDLYSPDDDREFHQLLYQNIDNTILSQIVDIFWVVFRQASERAAIPGPLNSMETYQRHVAIMNALAQRDVEAMTVAMTSHYEGIARRVRLAEQARSRPI